MCNQWAVSRSTSNKPEPKTKKFLFFSFNSIIYWFRRNGMFSIESILRWESVALWSYHYSGVVIPYLKRASSSGSEEALTRVTHQPFGYRRAKRKKKNSNTEVVCERYRVWESKWIFSGALRLFGVIVLFLALLAASSSYCACVYRLGCERVWYSSVTTRFIKQINELISRVVFFL